MCDNTRVVVNYLTVFFFKSINYYLLFTILWCIFTIIPRSNNLIQGIDFASIISWKEKLKKGTIETFLCLYSFLVSPSKTGSTYHNNGDPSGFWTLWKSFHTFVIHPHRPLRARALLLYSNSNRGPDGKNWWLVAWHGVFPSSVTRSHRVSICSDNEITIGRLPLGRGEPYHRIRRTLIPDTGDITIFKY